MGIEFGWSLISRQGPLSQEGMCVTCRDLKIRTLNSTYLDLSYCSTDIRTIPSLSACVFQWGRGHTRECFTLRGVWTSCREHATMLSEEHLKKLGKRRLTLIITRVVLEKRGQRWSSGQNQNQ